MTDWTPISPGDPSWVPAVVETANISAAESAAAAAASEAVATAKATAAASSASDAQGYASDAAATLAGAVKRDGTNTPTANLPMGGFRHTGVGAATTRTQYVDVAGLQDGKYLWADGGGTADAITATYAPVLTALVDGQVCHVRATAANATTTPTFSPNGITTHTIVKNGGNALSVGDIAGAGHELILRYDLTNTRWELLNPAINLSTARLDFAALAFELKGFAIGVQVRAGTYTGDLSDVMQEAQDRLAAVYGGTVVMGPGTFYMANIECGVGVTVEGAGYGYTLSNSSYQTTIQANDAGVIFTVGDGTNAIHGVHFRHLNFIGMGAGTAVKGIEFKTGSGWNGVEKCSFYYFSDQAIVSNGDNHFSEIFTAACLLNQTRTVSAGVVELNKDDRIIMSELGASQTALSTNFSVTADAAPVCTAALLVASSDVVAVNCLFEFCDVGYLATNGVNRSSGLFACNSNRNLAHGFVIDGSGVTITGCNSDEDGAAADATYDGVYITSRARSVKVNGFRCIVPGGSNATRHAINDNYAGGIDGAHSFSDISGEGISGSTFAVASTYLGSSFKTKSRHQWLPAGGTPSVDNNDFFTDVAESAVDITDFTNGVGAQRVTILASGNATFKQGSTIKLRGGADVTPAVSTTISFVNYFGVWYEV